jgi:hypothetical protein
VLRFLGDEWKFSRQRVSDALDRAFPARLFCRVSDPVCRSSTPVSGAMLS